MAILPDLKILFYIGWDMHLYRLAGTFFDPTFLGLIIVFGLILSIFRLTEKVEKKYIAITIFLLISLAFTYARACYLAFFVGILVIALLKKKFRKVIYLALGLVLIALILPTANNHSNALTRVFSITARITNYKETIQIIRKFPVFGVGYNNLCVARNMYIGEESFASHACSGSDSSLLLILATTGVVGFLVFIGGGIRIYQMLPKDDNKIILIASGAAVFTHSIFSNSLFYPWVMGYLIILLAVSLKE